MGWDQREQESEGWQQPHVDSGGHGEGRDPRRARSGGGEWGGAAGEPLGLWRRRGVHSSRVQAGVGAGGCMRIGWETGLGDRVDALSP